MKMIRITHEVWKKNGDIYLTVTVIRRLAKHVGKKSDGGKRARKVKGQTVTEPESAGADGPAGKSALTRSMTASPDGALPADWVFDDGARTVDLGGGQVMKLGRIQYGLLKYIAQGGRSTQEAWEQVWEYSSPVDWRTVRDTALRINERLGQCEKVLEIKVTTREVKILNPENQE